MAPSLPQCTQCNAPIAEGFFNRAELLPCPVCASPLQVEAFPALFRQHVPGREGEAVLVDGEAGCFYHPQKKAVRPCEGCGRFVCALCDCELHGAHYCPACLEAGAKRGKIRNLENKRILYDSMALAIAILPVILGVTWALTILTAPIALFIAIRYWNAPRSLVPRSRLRAVAAIVLALAQISVWAFVIYSAVT